jgi:2-hydroxy-6-oxonona-2,4-dienedioate hydrolase
MDAITDDHSPAPWHALEAEAALTRTPCGDGTMVWRAWGRTRDRTPPLVLLHGGAGSWLHWLRTIPAFAEERAVVVPDLPGLGDSSPPPASDPAGIAAIVAAGLEAVIGQARYDLAGFSFGGVIAGHLAARDPERVHRLVLVGSGGLGVVAGGVRLERVRDKVGAERVAAHRTNLHRWMIADPAAIDDEAVAIQDWNSRRARFDSRPVGTGDSLLAALADGHPGLAGVWGAHDHAMASEPERAGAVLRRLQPGLPFHVIPDAGHWVAHEAPDVFNRTLRRLLSEPVL